MVETNTKLHRNLEWIRSAFTDGLPTRRRSRKAEKKPTKLAVIEQHFGPMLKRSFMKILRNLRRSKGLKVKHWWFCTRLTQLMRELYPEADFKFSSGWFNRFTSCICTSRCEERRTLVSTNLTTWRVIGAFLCG